MNQMNDDPIWLCAAIIIVICVKLFVTELSEHIHRSLVKKNFECENINIFVSIH